MKNQIEKTLIILAFVSIYYSCSEDNNMDVPDLEESLSVVGTWKLTSYTFENSYDFNGDGVSSNDFMEETNCFNDIFLTFKEDGTGEETVPTSLSFSVLDDEIIIGCESNPTVDSKTWSLDGNELTVHGEILGFKAIVEGNSFSFTRNADALVQFLFGDEYSDNETLIYTKID